MKRMILGLMLVVLTNLEAGDSSVPCRVGSAQPSQVFNTDELQVASLGRGKKHFAKTAEFDTDFPQEKTTTPSVSSPITPSSALTGPHEQESDKN